MDHDLAITKRLHQAVIAMDAAKVVEVLRLHPTASDLACKPEQAGWLNFAMSQAALQGVRFKQAKPVFEALCGMRHLSVENLLKQACELGQPEVFLWLVKAGHSLMNKEARPAWIEKSLSSPEWMDPAALLGVFNRRLDMSLRAQVACLMLLRGARVEDFAAFHPQEWQDHGFCKTLPQVLDTVLLVRSQKLGNRDSSRVDPQAWGWFQSQAGEDCLDSVSPADRQAFMALVNHAQLTLATPSPDAPAGRSSPRL